MKAYADTSFLFSLYLQDGHSPTAARLIRRVPQPLLLTRLSEVELLNAFRLRVFRREIQIAEADRAAADFAEDVRGSRYLISSVTPAVFDQAANLVHQHSATIGCRTLDTLHVASALTLGATTFLSFDVNQRGLAAATGLSLLPPRL